MKQIIHVNQAVIRKNSKLGECNPVLTCKNYKSNMYGHEVELMDKVTGEVLAKFIYSPDKPLSCGAKVWFEFDTDKLGHRVIVNEENGVE